MSTALRVLILEDRPEDAELVVHQLRQAGFEPQWERVQTEQEYVDALERRPEVILSDFAMPEYDGLRALRLLRARDLDIPFILVSGTIGEDSAVACMQEGATDYLLKDRLGRLGPAITRALDQQRLRQEKRLAEQALRESEARKAAILESALECVITIDDKGTVLDFNPAAQATFGYTREQALGARLAELIIPPAQREQHRLGLERYLATGDGPLLGKRIEMTGMRSDGREFPVELTITPIMAGGPPIFTGFLRDITERKQAEESLRQAETRYRLLVEGLPAITYVVSAEIHPRTLYVSPQIEQVFGFTPEEWLADDTLWESHVHPEDVERVLAEDKASREDGRPFICEYRFITRDGRAIWLHDETYHFNEPGMPPFSQGIEFDITERKQHERELEAIAQISIALRSALTQTEMLPVILDQLSNLLLADGTAVGMREPGSGDTLIALGRGGFANSTGLRLPAGEGVIGQVIANAQPYVSENIEGNPGFVRPELLQDIRAVACVPLFAEGQSIGALLVGRETKIAEPEVRRLISIADIAANAIHRATLHQQTEQRLQRIAALHAIDMAIGSSLDLQFTLSVLLDQTTNQLRVDAADILLLDPNTNMLEYGAGRGFRTSAITQSKFRLGDGQPGWAALERQIVSIPDFAKAERPLVRSDLLRAEGFSAYYGVPLIAKGQVKGVLEIFHRQPLTPDTDWLDFLRTLAGQAALAIDDAALFNNLQQSNIELTMAYDATIEGWSRALDLRDKETEGHTQRVTEVTLRLARVLGVSETELIHLRRGGLLHDIGKMGVPDAILLKPGKLTDEEWEIMQKHPTYAYEMLSPINYLRPALDIPYCHHEKWDGSGYPRRLEAEQIPVAARIFAVVDVWDALRSDRPYRKAWSEQRVLEHIRSISGSHLDPQVVKVFMESRVYHTPS